MYVSMHDVTGSMCNIHIYTWYRLIGRDFAMDTN